MDVQLLRILRCPETRQPLGHASPGLLEKLNTQIEKGLLKNRAGFVVQEKIECGLLREDGRFMYPIRENLPLLLVDEGIPLN